MSKNPFIRRIEAAVDLGTEDRQALEQAFADRRRVGARVDLVAQGTQPHHAIVLLAGWACEQKILACGAHQITALLLPGDLRGSQTFAFGHAGEAITTLSPATVAEVPRETIRHWLDHRPGIVKALFWSSLVDAAIARSWVVNIGRRSAYERLAHLFCELWERLSILGMVEHGRFELPMTQNDLADAQGLTPIHVNRMLQKLRADGLIKLQGGCVTVPDIERLREAAEFDPCYLYASGGQPPRPPQRTAAPSGTRPTHNY